MEELQQNRRRQFIQYGSNMKKYLSNSAYTLVETIIVLTIVAIIMPAVFSILYSILLQQAKISELVETKRQGDYIMQFMKEKIARDASAIEEMPGGIPLAFGIRSARCNVPGSSYSNPAGNDFTFSDSQGNYFQFYGSGNKNLSYIQGSPTFINTTLHNNSVIISDFQISCIKKATYSDPMVAFSFTATFNRQNPDDQLGITQLRYQSKVKLRQ